MPHREIASLAAEHVFSAVSLPVPDILTPRDLPVFESVSADLAFRFFSRALKPKNGFNPNQSLKPVT